MLVTDTVNSPLSYHFSAMLLIDVRSKGVLSFTLTYLLFCLYFFFSSSHKEAIKFTVRVCYYSQN